jgi:hypothetical protein
MEFRQNTDHSNASRRIAAAGGLLAITAFLGGCGGDTVAGKSAADQQSSPNGPADESCQPIIVGTVALDAAEREAVLAGTMPEEVAVLNAEQFFGLQAVMPADSTEEEKTQADQVIFGVLEGLKLTKEVQTQKLIIVTKTDDTLELTTYKMPDGCEIPTPIIEIPAGPYGVPA